MAERRVDHSPYQHFVGDLQPQRVDLGGDAGDVLVVGADHLDVDVFGPRSSAP